ncbi:MAG: CoA transferase [Chloroflexota bacterium]
MGALSGYRVLDLTDEKGMLGARLLADMDAEVIRIEKPGVDSSRNGAEFAYLNAGKRSVSLDLEKEEGRELFKKLVTTADVLIETSPPGYLGSLGLDYAKLSEINPGLVMASITDFGQDGPYRDYKSSDLVVGALGGWLSVCGEPDAPLQPYGNQACRTASLFAANAVLLALWHRHATGRGQYIDISVMECVVATLDHVLPRYFSEGVVSRRQGSRHWNDAFRIFRCQDGYILVSLFQHWETLVEWLDSEGMAEDLTDAKWLEREERLRGADHIAEVLARWTSGHTAAELVEKGQLMRFPWAKVAALPEFLASPQLAGRDFFAEVEVEGVKYQSPGAPFRMGRSPLKVGGRVPVVGEGNQDIYRGELGKSASEMTALEKDGAI